MFWGIHLLASLFSLQISSIDGTQLSQTVENLLSNCKAALAHRVAKILWPLLSETSTGPGSMFADAINSIFRFKKSLPFLISSSELWILHMHGTIRDLSDFECNVIVGARKTDSSISDTINFHCFFRTRMSRAQCLITVQAN